MPIDIISDHNWTDRVADWFSVHSYGLELPAITDLLERAKRIAAEDGRAVVSRNDPEAAQEIAA